LKRAAFLNVARFKAHPAALYARADWREERPCANRAGSGGPAKHPLNSAIPLLSAAKRCGWCQPMSTPPLSPKMASAESESPYVAAQIPPKPFCQAWHAPASKEPNARKLGRRQASPAGCTAFREPRVIFAAFMAFPRKSFDRCCGKKSPQNAQAAFAPTGLPAAMPPRRRIFSTRGVFKKRGSAGGGRPRA